MEIALEHVSKAYGGQSVLRDFSHVFPEGRVACVVGSSGCGKTTLLRLIAGLEAPDSGRITPAPEGIAMVFQEDRLPPQLTAAGCLRSVLPRTLERDEAIAGALRALGLWEDRDKPVREYSGGMRRRVALARALLFPSPWLLMDEPFKGLDEQTRAQAVAFALPRMRGRTTVMVTHDLREAELLGGEVLRLGALQGSL